MPMSFVIFVQGSTLMKTINVLSLKMKKKLFENRGGFFGVLNIDAFNSRNDDHTADVLSNRKISACPTNTKQVNNIYSFVSKPLIKKDHVYEIINLSRPQLFVSIISRYLKYHSKFHLLVLSWSYGYKTDNRNQTQISNI
jgi:hypothetical protein